MNARDILVIAGEYMDMAEDTRVTLTFVSPILTDISKQAASYSQTINLPRTARNERLLGLPLSLTATTSAGAFRYTKKSARLERNGLTIAEGDVYLLDSTAESISVAFIFGRVPGLERLKALEININNLTAIEQMEPRAWKSTADTSLNYTKFIFPRYNTGATPTEMEATKVGYYGAVSVNASILTSIAYLCGGITKTTAATNVLRNLWIMARTANDSSYTASLTPTTFTPTGGQLVAQTGGGGTVGPSIPRITRYDYYPTFSATTVANGKYGEVVEATINNIAGKVYQASADQSATVGTNNVVLTFTTERGEYNDVRAGGCCVVFRIKSEDGERERRIEGPKITAYSVADGLHTMNFGSVSQAVDLEEGEQLQISIYIPTPSNGIQDVEDVEISGSFYVRSSSLKESIQVGELYHPTGNLPDLKPIDFLRNIAMMLGLYITPDADTGGLKIATLNEVLENLGAAEDWTTKVVANERGDIALNHYFSVADYKAQRNIIAYKEDNNDIDQEKLSESARNIVITCNNEGLEEEKVLATLPFALTYRDNMRHYEYKEPKDEEGEAEINRKELAPRIVRLSVTDGVVVASASGLSGQELAGVNLQSLQTIVKQPHRIKLQMRLTTWDIKNLNLETPVYLSQFGCYFLVSQVQTTATDIAEVELVKIN